jgi:DNA polymerase elongation subunit (family B)
MIVNTELLDVINSNKEKTKQIILSYVNKEHGISTIEYVIPKEDLYSWKYAKGGDVKDSKMISWDDKPVVKYYQKDCYINMQRVHEILIDLEKEYSNMSVIYELNVPDIAYCDIEVEVGNDGFPRAEDAFNQVNTISWVQKDMVIVFGRAALTEEQTTNIQKKITEHCSKFTTSYKFYYKYYNTEVEMLTDFMFNYVKKIPCLTGWNFLGYDWMYLYNRCERLSIDITSLSPTNGWFSQKLLDMFNTQENKRVKLPMHKLIYDYMEVYFKWDMSISPHESYKLDDVANIVLGVKKVEHNLGFTDMWKQTPDDYVFYNAIDSILVREIDLKLKTNTIMYSIANLIHCDVLMAFSPVQSLQIAQGEFLYKENKVFPTIKKEEYDVSEGYEGAFVFTPVPGAYKNVIALDFASLYPTTMRQFNISPDTFIKKDKNHVRKDDEIKTSSGAVYQRNKEGILPKIITEVYNKRKSYKKEMKKMIEEKYYLKDILNKRENKIKEQLR